MTQDEQQLAEQQPITVPQDMSQDEQQPVHVPQDTDTAEQQPIHVSGEILRDSRASPANFAPILSKAVEEFERIDARVADLKNRLALELAKQKLGMYCSPQSLIEELRRESANHEATRLALLGLRAIEAARDAQPPVPAPIKSKKLAFDRQAGCMVEQG